LRATKNPKAEFRSPKEVRNSKAEKAQWSIRVSVLGFLSDFDLRNSDFRNGIRGRTRTG